MTPFKKAATWVAIVSGLVLLLSLCVSRHPTGAQPGGHRMGFGIQPSPACLVQDGAGAFLSAAPYGVNVGAGDTITVELASYSGTRSWSLTVFGLDDLTNPSPPILAYNVGPPINYTFTYPVALGRAVLLKSVVNGGVDVNGVVQPSYTMTIGVFSLTSIGTRVLAMGETFETCPVGWVCDVNNTIRSATGGIASVYGGIHTSSLATIAFDGGAWLPVPFPVADVAASNIDAGTSNIEVAVPADLFGIASVGFNSSVTTQLQFELYKNDAGIVGSIRQVNVTTATDAGFASVTSDAILVADAGDTFGLYAYSPVAANMNYQGNFIVHNANTSRGVAGAPGPAGSGGSIGGGACGASQSGAIVLPTLSGCIAVDLTSLDATVNVGSVVTSDGLAYQFDLQAGTKSIIFSGATFVSVANGSTTPLTSLAIQGGGQSVIIKYNAANSWWTTP